MTLDEAAAELYAGLPADFVARRAELARAAKSAGDAALAKQIAALRRPTAGAWLANLLCREHHDQVEQLVELGAALRAAQDGLDADQLRELGRQRREVVAALVGVARRDAAALGHPAAGAAAEELEGTLTAALADPEAAAQVLSGRLSHGLTYAGLGFGTAGASQASAPSARTAATAAKASAPKAAGRSKAGATNAGPDPALLDAAERELTQARLHAAAAQAESDAAQQRQTAAQDAVRTVDDEVARLEAELEAANERRHAAQADVTAAAKETAASARAVQAAERDAERAAAAVDKLRT